MLSAIIVAGGSSSRMGFDKTFAQLAGKPVIAHTIAAFEAAECVDEIIIVGRRERISDLENLSRQYAFTKVRCVIAGGVHRQDSVANGLKELTVETLYVAVHDAARPLVRPLQIGQVFAAACVRGAAALAGPVTDTLKRASADLRVNGSIERDGVYAMQTPQIVARDLLMEAFAVVAAQKLAITDEVSAVQAVGRAVVLVPNDDLNFKITVPADLAMAEIVLTQRAR